MIPSGVWIDRGHGRKPPSEVIFAPWNSSLSRQSKVTLSGGFLALPVASATTSLSGHCHDTDLYSCKRRHPGNTGLSVRDGDERLAGTRFPGDPSPGDPSPDDPSQHAAQRIHEEIIHGRLTVYGEKLQALDGEAR